MKILDKLTLILFSIIILVFALIIEFLMFGIIRFSVINTFYNEIIANKTLENVIVVSSIVCAILALRAILYGASYNTETNEGVLLENEAGRLLISKDTIENLVNGVAKGFENTQSVSTKVIVDSKNELKVYVTLLVLPSTVINELSINLQTRIKEVVKNVTNLDVKTIDIKIKNITTPEAKSEI